MSRRDLEALLAYLAENAGRHSLDALRAQMVKAGHTPAGADRAIAVFQGRAQPPGRPVWPIVLTVAIVDLVLAATGLGLFSRFGMGQAACSALVLVPGAYLAELFTGLVFLGSGKDRWGRGLLLGFLLFCGLVAAVLMGFLIHWLSRVTGGTD